jgi:hypothetical protein
MNHRKINERNRCAYGGGTGLRMSRSQQSQGNDWEEPARSYDCCVDVQFYEKVFAPISITPALLRLRTLSWSRPRLS